MTYLDEKALRIDVMVGHTTVFEVTGDDQADMVRRLGKHYVEWLMERMYRAQHGAVDHAAYALLENFERADIDEQGETTHMTEDWWVKEPFFPRS